MRDTLNECIDIIRVMKRFGMMYNHFVYLINGEYYVETMMYMSVSDKIFEDYESSKNELMTLIERLNKRTVLSVTSIFVNYDEYEDNEITVTAYNHKKSHSITLFSGCITQHKRCIDEQCYNVTFNTDDTYNLTPMKSTNDSPF